MFDVIFIVTGFSFSFWFVFRSGFYGNSRSYPSYFLLSIILIALIFLFVFQLEGLYKYQAIANPIHQIQSLIKCYFRVLAAFIILVFFMKTKYISDSRLTIGLGFIFSFIFMSIARVYLIPKIFRFFVGKGLIRKRVLIIGAGEQGKTVLSRLQISSRNYFEIIGFCDDNLDLFNKKIFSKEVLGATFELKRITSEYNIKEVIISISNIERGALLELIDRCRECGLTIHVISELFSKVTEKLEAEEFGGLVTYRIESRQNGLVRDATKRLLDLFGSLILLILLAPAFLIIAWAIKKDSKGPVIFKTEVIGKKGEKFTTYKFRSMISANPDNPAEAKKYVEGYNRHEEFMKEFIQGNIKEESFFVEDESRITKVGKILRKYSLDELPQLINVLRGEMSLVGPRFSSVTEYSFYKPWQKRRLQVKPGMTGLWQVRARSEVTYDDMVMMDLYYIQNWSILFDIEILLRTIPVVLSGKGSRVK